MIVFAYVPRPRDGNPDRLRSFIEQFAPLADIDEGVGLEVELARGELEDIERPQLEMASIEASGKAVR